MKLIRQLKKPGYTHEAGLSHCWFRTVIMSQQQHQQHPVIHYTSESSWAMVKSLFFLLNWVDPCFVKRCFFFCLGRRQVFALCQRGISQTDYFSRGTCGCVYTHILSHLSLARSLSLSLSLSLSYVVVLLLLVGTSHTRTKTRTPPNPQRSHPALEHDHPHRFRIERESPKTWVMEFVS